MMGIDAKLTGSQILARSLRSQQLSVLFYIMGGPMLEAEASCIEEGLRTIDVRHEAAAVMMAQAYGRVTGTPAVCMAASGPGMANLIPGLANALADCFAGRCDWRFKPDVASEGVACSRKSIRSH